MEETLIIKKFGPIESVELKLKRFTILIGEQATGKSTVAKVLAVCRYFSYLKPVKSVIDYFEQGLKAWGLFEHIRFGKTYIEYSCEDYFFKAQHKIIKEYEGEDNYSEYPSFETSLIPLSDKFKRLLDEVKKISPANEVLYNYSVGNYWGVPTSFYQNEVARVVSNPFFLPVERGLQSVFSLGKNTIQNISDSLFNQLSKLDHTARAFKELIFIEPLDIEYKNENGQGFIRLKDKSFFSLYNGASGYQSTIPVVLTVEYYSTIRKKSKTFIIEEPELNLFPIAQNKLMMYLVDKAITYNHQMLLTTHSPYILTSLNNLLYAYQIGQEHTEQVSEIVNKKYWLNSDDISAYRLFLDGTAKNILDEELKQIDTGELDEVSRELNGIWDKIADIEFSSAHER